VTPFYFGKTDKALFGIYHPPANDRDRRCGIVLCQPMGSEYILGYRALRQLALQLARAGFSVLRFDYYGCGDSAGEAHEGSLTQWLTDTETAIEEIKSHGTFSKICLIGARIGAAVALQVGSKRSDIEAVVLWDPVVDGKDYLNDLIAQHQEWLNDRPRSTPPPDPSKEMLEVLGFPIGPALEENLKQLNLLHVKTCPARRVLTLETDITGHGRQLNDYLKEVGWDSEYQHISAPRVWQRRTGYDNAVVPLQTLQGIVGWASRITS
jgi:pimeloyl-ACP methyl ester carboxylesterase